MSDKELNCKWHFAEKKGGGDTGPNEPMAENFKKNKWISLVREAIQNSLDAVYDVERPVKVVFDFKSLYSRDYPHFLELLKEIEECRDFYPTDPNAQQMYPPMIKYLRDIIKNDRFLPYIQVSDYNTKGMDYVRGKTDSPFYAFVRAAGVSSKNDASAGGSFGFGKAAYFYLSEIRTLIVSTKTVNGDCFFEGVAYLCTHGDGKTKKEAIGYYDNNDGEPVRSLGCMDDIPEIFMRDEAGTDFYIMGVRDLVDEDSKESIRAKMTEAILRNFWLAIYENKLEVEVFGERICSENLAEKMEDYNNIDDTKNLIAQRYNPRPYFEAVRFADSDDNHVCIRKKLPSLGDVLFYAYKDKSAFDQILYMRSPRMLVYGKKNGSRNGFYGVFVCDDKKGNEILRRMENPSHDKWDVNQDEFHKDENEQAKSELADFIKRCVEQLFPANNEMITQIDGLENYLYIPVDVENDENEKDDYFERDDVEQTSLVEKSEINQGKTVKPNVRQAEGQVVTNVRTRAVKRGDGSLLSGHGTRKVKTKGGSIGTGNLNQKNALDEDGVEGTYAIPINVKYRSYAKRVKGELYHYLIIRSDVDVPNARLDVTVCGAQDDECINIKSSGHGKIHKNSISELHIEPNPKKNVIKIQFTDNLKHAIKLEPYEIK
jgi:hypothetical protein